MTLLYCIWFAGVSDEKKFRSSCKLNKTEKNQIIEIGFNFSFRRHSVYTNIYIYPSSGVFAELSSSIINRTVSGDSITLFVFSLMRHFSGLIYWLFFGGCSSIKTFVAEIHPHYTKVDQVVFSDVSATYRPETAREQSPSFPVSYGPDKQLPVNGAVTTSRFSSVPNTVKAIVPHECNS